MQHHKKRRKLKSPPLHFFKKDKSTKYFCRMTVIVILKSIKLFNNEHTDVEAVCGNFTIIELSESTNLLVKRKKNRIINAISLKAVKSKLIGFERFIFINLT